MLKIMDYMTFGKPIVMFETTEGKVTAGDAALYLTENDNMLFANSIVELLHDQPRRDKMGEISRKRIETELNWDIQKENLRKAYAFLDR
jgi:glycosyltransferase involved in cell wall biosynthesis